jgi:hypothetical protein
MREVLVVDDHPILVVRDGGSRDDVAFNGVEGNDSDVVTSEGQQHRYVRASSTRGSPTERPRQHGSGRR